MKTWLLAAATLLCAPVWAQAQAPSAGTLHQVTGFRSALFGMTAPEVRAAIARDFQAADEVITELDNPAEKTRVLAVRLASLEPAAGPAVLTYVLGAQSRRLVRVNVTWRSGAAPSDDERNRMGAAGLQLASYFRTLAWKSGGQVSNQREGPNAVLLFAGVDQRNAAVEVHLAGIYLTSASGVSAAPSGPAMLRVAYIQDLRQPDVVKVVAP